MDLCVLTDRYPDYNASGAGNVARDLAEVYHNHGHQVTVITTTRDPESAGIKCRDGYRIWVIHSPSRPRFRAYYSIYNPYTIPEIKRIFNRGEFDAVHAHNVHEYLSYNALRIASNHTDRVILTFHDAMSIAYGKLSNFVNEGEASGTPPMEAYNTSAWKQMRRKKFRYFPLRNMIIRQYLSRYVTDRIAVSNELARALNANGVKCDQVIHNGIDVSSFSNGNGERFRNRHSIDNENIILFPSRVSRMKGGGKLASAFAQIAENHDVLLVITGSKTDYVNQMREIATKHGEKIRTTGWIERQSLINAYHASNICVTPSIYLDPFPLVNLEAMAAGTPVITTCYGGSKELVQDGETGFIINPFNQELFADRLTRILSNQKLQLNLGRKGKERVRNKFMLGQQASKYLELLS